MPPRVVTLVLCNSAGELLGALPEFVVAVPWWQHIDVVVAGARQAHGVDVRVLRLLRSEGPPTRAVVRSLIWRRSIVFPTRR